MKNPSCSARSTATARFLVAAIFIALVSAGPVVAATTLQIGVTPPSSVNEFRSSAILTWNSETGAVYKIQSRVSLDASTPWVTEDAVLATGTTASWTAPGSLQQAMFYQLLLPQPEIFSVEPAVVTPGVTTDFYVVGQRFPTNAVLRINGVTKSNAVVTSSTLITAPAFTPDLPGTYQFQLVVSGLVVSTFTVTAADPLAHPEQVLQGPPTEPPASPTTSFSLNFAKMDVKYEPQNKDGSAGRGVGGGGYPIDPDGPGGNPPVSLGRSVLHISRYSDDDDPAKCPTRFSAIGRRSRSNIQNNFTTEGIIGFNLQGRDNDQAFANTDFTRGGGGGGGGAKYLSLMKAKEKANQCKSPILPDGGVHPFSGEVRVSDADMIIPGRVLDFVWARTYRSRTGTNTTMGQRWSHSYDIHVEQNSGGILRSDGTGRRDLFTLSTNGVYSLNEFFEEGTISNNAFTLTFPDTGKWVFNPFDFSATAGKLSRIVDRNGNTMTLGYNTGGKLVTVVDDLGRTNTIAYNTDGYVASVTDFTGRPVTYQYYHGLAGENGGLGDLASVTSPPVIGTPTGNDFPAGKTISYAYSMGFANEAENHLLLKVTDPKGAFASQFTYEHTSADPNYLHCIADQSGTNTASRFSWTVRAPQPGNFATTKCFINDPVGNLTECSFDSRNRLLLEREFTGRCVPGSPVTATVNRPTGKVRASDPDFYDTACVWNNDSLCTLMTLPLGNSLACFYARDLDGGTTARKKGDLRVKHELGSGGGADTDGDGFPDTTVLTTTYQYDSRFGFAARDYCVQYRESEMEFLRRATYWIKNSNSGGTPRIARYKGWDGTIKGLSMLPGPGDEGPQESLDFARKGWDGTIKGTSKYGRVKVQFHWDRESPRASYVNPRSISRQQYFFNQTCRLLPTVNKREKLRGTTKTQGDFNLANRFSFEIDFVTSTTDPRGNVSTASYDAKGNRPQCVSISTSSCGANKPVIDFVYDNHGLLTAITNCPDANCSRRVDTFSYYTNGSQAGYLQSCVVDATGLALASTFEYDPRGNMTRGIDPRTNDWLYTYNALDQIVQQQSATLSLCFCKITYNYKYDANDNVTLIEVQNRDGAGNLGTNAFWDTVLAYDLENRLIGVTQPTSGPSTATTRYAYDGNDQCTLVSSPEAVAGRDPSNVTQYLYDERKMLFCVIDAPGTALQHNKDVSYDANGRVALVASTSDICGPTPGCKQADCTFVYDGFGRCVSFTDAMGNVGTCAYDRNANLIYTRVDAETNDVPGSVGNRRFAECRYSYDDLDRCVKLSNGFFDPATQTPVGNGIAVTTCAYAFNGECVSVTDALSHTCAFAYDTACRLASMTDARGDVVTCVRDRNGNPTSVAETDVSDLGGTQSFSTACTYDNLNRLVQCVDNVGNSNLFAYDSRDNCVSQTDPRGNETVFAYDGLSRPVSFTRYQGLAVAGIQLRGGRYTLDDNSRCVSSSDGNSNVTRYAYDARDRLVTITNADFTVQKLVWSPRSNLIGEQDANGSSISNTFDLCDRLVGLTGVQAMAGDIGPGLGQGKCHSLPKTDRCAGD